MHAETLLPLGKVDPGLRAPATPLDISEISKDARTVEALGYDALVFEETKDDPFVLLALAAQATSRLALGTAVAIAFPRSPAVMAMSAWSIQKLSRGRLTLGLGPQVRGHIQRRYGMTPHPAGPWMRDYVGAVRAFWTAWQSGDRLDYESDHYRVNLMVPLFDPGPIADPDIPIHLAAVNTVMCRVAGEVADGIRPHPVCTPEYIRDVMLPAVRDGARRAGRSLRQFRVCIKPLIATARDEKSLHDRIHDARARIAFYASTPAYRAAFAHHGLDALADEARHLSRAQRWEELPALVSDDVLNRFVTIAPFDRIGNRLLERYGTVATNAEFSIPVDGPEGREMLSGLVRQLQDFDPVTVRNAITGKTP